MLNSINFKKLTANGILAVLVAGSLIVPSNLVDANNGNGNSNGNGKSSCNSNNGHGNNAPIDITLSDGFRITGTYDPSNPGKSAKNQLTVYNNKGKKIGYDQLTSAQLAEFNSKVQDIELRGLGSGNSNCVNDSSTSSTNTSSNTQQTSTTNNSSTTQQAPKTIELTGTIRDFKGYRKGNAGDLVSGGHPDFERKAGTDKNPQGQTFDYGLDQKITTDTLGSDKKPVYAGGSYSTTTKENFDQWYRDVPGVNQSVSFPIKLEDPDGDGIYIYTNSSFFPVDGQLFGNEGRNKNYHFTYELNTQFTYKGGETFKFSGDDDVWVYINGKKVIDIGGVHSKLDAEVKLDQVASQIGLEKGKTYDLDFFFAERHTTESNFTITTSIVLENAPETTQQSNGNNSNNGEQLQEQLETIADKVNELPNTNITVQELQQDLQSIVNEVKELPSTDITNVQDLLENLESVATEVSQLSNTDITVEVLVKDFYSIANGLNKDVAIVVSDFHSIANELGITTTDLLEQFNLIATDLDKTVEEVVQDFYSKASDGGITVEVAAQYLEQRLQQLNSEGSNMTEQEALQAFISYGLGD